MVSSALNVPCYKIASKLRLSFWRMFLEQMIRNLIGETSINFLSVLVEKTQYHGLNVNQMVSVELLPVEEITESPEYFLVGEDDFEQTVYHGVPESEGGGRELVEDGRVCILVVFALTVQVKLVLLHESPSFSAVLAF